MAFCIFDFMKLLPDQIYHIYNQGNNQETIFKDDKDYINFLRRFRDRVLPYAEVICYCLMPNHYHFLVYTNESSVETIQLGSLETQALQNCFRLLNSGYANEFNNKYQRTGSLFRQKTKFKSLIDNHSDYPFVCFNYIHQNPMRAGLVKKMEDWQFSSFQDFLGERNGTLCNFELASQLLDIQKDDFYETSYSVINENLIDKLY